MDDLAMIRTLARYNRWMNRSVYACAERLPDEERKRDRGAYFGSIQRTLNHLLLADRIWIGRFGAGGFAAELAERWMVREVSGVDMQLHAEFAPLFAERRELDDALVAWTATLTGEHLAASLRYARLDGTVVERPLRLALMHLFNHQTHHRGQVTTLLMQAGIDPGVTDLVAMPADA